MTKLKFIELTRRSWRPALAWIMILAIFLYLIVGFFISLISPQVILISIPTEAWVMITTFISTMGLGRTAEKVTKYLRDKAMNKDEDV